MLTGAGAAFGVLHGRAKLVSTCHDDLQRVVCVNDAKTTATVDERMADWADGGRFWLLAGVLVVGPWLFGAWEWWWFALLLVPIALAALLGGVALALRAPALPLRALGRAPHMIWISAAPFLVYAIARTLPAPVPMDAVKMLLIHLSAWTVGISVALGMTRGRQWLLWRILLWNLVLLAVYGIVNHALTGSEKVMWVAGYPQYYEAGRLGGTYFCPSHFSGVMELLLGMGLAGIASRATRRRGVYAAVCLLAVGVIVATKTRGGGLTVLVMLVALIIWGPGEQRPLARWSWRAVAVSLVVLGLMAFAHIDTPFRQRFIDYFGVGRSALPVREQVRVLLYERLPRTSRGRMFGGAWRAWQTAPWTGIGMGMHSAYWPFFAATDDGDRERGIWPTLTNENFHSYEVHNDWLQLLEELGMIGLALFLIPFGVVLRVLLRDRRQLCRGSPYEHRAGGDPRLIPLLAGLLASVAMAFHSLGDFNLQMPATSWLLAALIAIPVGLCRRQRERGEG